MNKTRFAIIGIILSCISLPIFAKDTTCPLGKWCSIKRASDSALIQITPENGTNYKCTLIVDGNFDIKKDVNIRLSGSQGYVFEAASVSAHQGGSWEFLVNGTFSDSKVSDPLIVLLRLPNNNNNTNENSRVMCKSA